MTTLNQEQINNISNTANTIKDLCNVSDRVAINNLPAGSVNIDGWTNVHSDYNPKNGFKAATFQKGNQLVICYVGTNFKSLKDIAADAKMPFAPTAQMKEADEYLKRIKSNFQDENITLSGHSEGGSEAQYVCVKNGGLPTVTFNAFMTGGLFSKQERELYKDSIINYRNRDDIVSKMGIDIGHQLILTGEPKTNPYINAVHIKKNHSLDGIDCSSAVSLEYYKQLDPHFEEKLDNVIIKREDIKDLTSEEFDLLENYLLKRAKNGELLYNDEVKQKALSGDLIHIKAYTRYDGTYVKEHYRKAKSVV